MINIEDYEIFNSNISTLKETSIDDHDKNNILYMTESLRQVVNFDNVKYEYVKDMNLSDIPKSNDALFLNKNNKLVFVEFKNGFMGKKKYDIRKKIYDSIIILTDILNIGISRLKNDMEYILVYNETDNKDEDEVKNSKSYVQPSDSYDTIAKIISSYAKTEYVYFGVNIFENYCFHKVHTYTEKEFEKYLQYN